jgi:hypothetical protein
MKIGSWPEIGENTTIHEKSIVFVLVNERQDPQKVLPPAASCQRRIV